MMLKKVNSKHSNKTIVTFKVFIFLFFLLSSIFPLKGELRTREGGGGHWKVIAITVFYQIEVAFNVFFEAKHIAQN